jgi:transcriptional regulator with XRE-family HTH domain
MKNTNTDHKRKKLPKNAIEMLRLEPGSLSRIARRLQISRSMVSRVMRGQRRSQRVVEGIVAESRRIARLYGAAAVLLEIEHSAEK